MLTDCMPRAWGPVFLSLGAYAVTQGQGYAQPAAADEVGVWSKTQGLTRSQFERRLLNRQVALVMMKACGSSYY